MLWALVIRGTSSSANTVAPRSAASRQPADAESGSHMPTITTPVMNTAVSVIILFASRHAACSPSSSNFFSTIFFGNKRVLSLFFLILLSVV